MLTRFACPPLMPFAAALPIFTSLHCDSASFSSSWSTASSFSAYGSDTGRFSSAVYMSICCCAGDATSHHLLRCSGRRRRRRARASLTVRMPSSVSNCST